MVWPVGELQLFYKVPSSCLLRKGKRGKGCRREGERRRGEIKKTDISTSYIKDIILISNIPEIIMIIIIIMAIGTTIINI